MCYNFQRLMKILKLSVKLSQIKAYQALSEVNALYYLILKGSDDMEWHKCQIALAKILVGKCHGIGVLKVKEF